MMFESIEIINKLFTGKVVKHKGEFFTLESAKLYTRPEEPVPVYVATAGPINAKKTGKFADGIITVGAADEKISMLWEKYEEGAREAGKEAATTPKLLQIHVSWARTDEEAVQNAMVEWPNGGMPFPKQDVKNPEDFAAMAKLVKPEDFKNRVLMTSDLEAHTKHIQHYVDMGFDEIHLHNVGPQPGRVHRGLRQGRAAEPAAWLSSRARPSASPRAPARRARRRGRCCTAEPAPNG